ncbi:LSU ribosomal protein L5p [Paenibacillus sp. JCM 10914]|nr:LSU ribosomal protein L5p [Paenibacillus sp. JCM 10914]
MAARMKERFLNEVTPALMQKFSYSTVMQVPKIEKVVVNMGVGDAVANSKVLDSAVNDMQLIAGQKPVITRAKKSIAGFKLRENMPIGVKVTLRGELCTTSSISCSTLHFHVYVTFKACPPKHLTDAVTIRSV